MVDISKTSIDFSELVTELEADLQAKDSFQALFPGETGKIFSEQGAGITAMLLYAIDSAAQNAFMPTAFSQEAIYALAISLGIPPRRKIGAIVTLQLTVNSTLATPITLPKFTRFSGRSLEWYTTEDIIIPAGASGQTLSFNVRQGERITDTFISTGNSNQRLEIGEDFNIDEEFVVVTIDTVEYAKNGVSLLDSSPGDLVYAEQTAANGRTLILFGNEILGSIPTIGASIEISYANTAGVNSNSSIIGDNFQLVDSISIGGGQFLSVAALTTSASTSGADEESISQIKLTAPKLYAANSRAVRRDDYIGHILRITGAPSANTWGEYEEAQQKSFADLTMMNRAYISVIPTTLNNESTIPFIGTGALLNFSGNIGFTNIIPGSVRITSDTGTWEDIDGKGVLLSPDNTVDQIDGTGTSSATEEDGFNTADRAFDALGGTIWESTTKPTVFNPIRLSYDFGAGNEVTVRSIRIFSAPSNSAESRSYPKQVVILASNVVSPDITTRDDWEVLRGSVLLEDPGPSLYGKLIPVDDISNTTTYRHFALEILDSYGDTSVSIGNLELQDSSNESTIDYITGAVTLNYATGNEPTGNLDSVGISGNFSQTQKDDLISSLSDLNHFTTLINYRDAVAKPVDVIAEVRYLEGFDPVAVQSEVEAAIDSLFEPDGDTLNEPMYLSDIYQAIQDISSVDYSIITSPVSNTNTEIDQFVSLRTRTLTVLPTDR